LGKTRGSLIFLAFTLYLVLAAFGSPMGGSGGVRPQHAALPRKKSRKSRLFLFDLRKSRPYNPRPRCFAALAAELCFPLILDVKIVGGRCLTL
jgi:hypothetical protein